MKRMQCTKCLRIDYVHRSVSSTYCYYCSTFMKEIVQARLNQWPETAGTWKVCITD